MIARTGFVAGIGLLLAAVLAALLSLAPRPPTMADIAAIISERATPQGRDWAYLIEQARAGDATAQNNLGVALWRTPAEGGPDSPEFWFRAAAAQGHVQARYNLALMLPDRFDTDPAIVEEGLALLQANAALGDIPSMVALADRLYFTNREAFVPNLEAVRRDLLLHAAATGDPDYMQRAGSAIWKDVRGGADPALLEQALPLLAAAHQAGDPRGAETIGDIMASGNSAYKDAIVASGLLPHPLHWFGLAGDMGLMTAHCRLGLETFQTLRWTASFEADDLAAWLRALILTNAYTPEHLARAISDLEACAAADSGSRPRTNARPFGSPDLYAYKLRPNWTSLANSPGHAALTLGVLYGYGIGTQADPALARRYLTDARDLHGFDTAAPILARLE